MKSLMSYQISYEIYTSYELSYEPSYEIVILPMKFHRKLHRKIAPPGFRIKVKDLKHDMLYNFMLIPQSDLFIY